MAMARLAARSADPPLGAQALHLHRQPPLKHSCRANTCCLQDHAPTFPARPPPRCHAVPLTPAHTPHLVCCSPRSQSPAPWVDTPSPSMCMARHTEPPLTHPVGTPHVPSFPKQDCLLFPIPVLAPLTRASWQPSPLGRKHSAPKGQGAWPARQREGQS